MAEVRFATVFSAMEAECLETREPMARFRISEPPGVAAPGGRLTKTRSYPDDRYAFLHSAPVALGFVRAAEPPVSPPGPCVAAPAPAPFYIFIVGRA